MSAARRDDGWQTLDAEIDILKRCRHPNVLEFVKRYEGHRQQLGFLSELAELGSLDDVLFKRADAILEGASVIIYRHMNVVPVAGPHVHQFAVDVVTGMDYLVTQQKILHRDLKGANVLLFDVDDSTRCKIADFGLSIDIDMEVEGRMTGTPQYCAPEVIHAQPCTEKSDVFSFAILLWSLLTRAMPYQGACIDVGTIAAVAHISSNCRYHGTCGDHGGGAGCPLSAGHPALRAGAVGVAGAAVLGPGPLHPTRIRRHPAAAACHGRRSRLRRAVHRAPDQLRAGLHLHCHLHCHLHRRPLPIHTADPLERRDRCGRRQARRRVVVMH